MGSKMGSFCLTVFIAILLASHTACAQNDDAQRGARHVENNSNSRSNASPAQGEQHWLEPVESTANLKVFNFGNMGRWRLIENRYWQKINPDSDATPPWTTPAVVSPSALCPAGMVHVRGSMVNSSEVNSLQAQHCTSLAGVRAGFHVCFRYDRDRYAQAIDNFKRSHPEALLPLDFCMDRYEYPNIENQNPVIAINWFQAEQVCARQGKRLCEMQEWTFACEGENAQPYPYEHWETRLDANGGGCVVGAAVNARRSLQPSATADDDDDAEDNSNQTVSIDPVCQPYDDMVSRLQTHQQGRENNNAHREHRSPRRIRKPSLRVLLGRYNNSDPHYGNILACMWGAAPSGSANGCVSPTGVHDMAGNIDEWTTAGWARTLMDAAYERRRQRQTPGNTAPPVINFAGVARFSTQPYPSMMKGGYWGPVRTRCRPVTGAHGPSHTYYQQGFRCCLDRANPVATPRSPATQKKSGRASKK